MLFLAVVFFSFSATCRTLCLYSESSQMSLPMLEASGTKLFLLTTSARACTIPAPRGQTVLRRLLFHRSWLSSTLVCTLLLSAGDIESNPGPQGSPQPGPKIRCVCSSSEEKGFMVQCSICCSWLHSKCVKFSQSTSSDTPFTYPYCVYAFAKSSKALLHYSSTLTRTLHSAITTIEAQFSHCLLLAMVLLNLLFLCLLLNYLVRY